MIKVVLCGPPHAGKSVLREGLKEAIRTLTNSRLYCYPITANPDGEGAWFPGAVEHDRDHAALLKKQYKRSLRGEGETAFTPERVQLWEDWVRNTPVQLSLVDIGGRIDDANSRICRHATHAVILGRDETSLRDWDRFCAGLGLGMIARLLSDYHAPFDEIDSRSDAIRGRLHRLERGEPIATRPSIQDLARRLIAMTDGFSTSEVRTD
jgi:CRISPR-associated protein Csx3